jgi:arylsulfatase A-like enzyme
MSDRIQSQMLSSQKNTDNEKVTFRGLFRPIFVIFFLYLLGDAFYRWDGFRHYASFSDFLPSVSLAAVLWSIVSAIFALIVWIFIEFISSFCQYKKTDSGPFVLFIYFFILLTLAALFSSFLIWPNKHPFLKLPFYSKLLLPVIAAAIAVIAAWILRKRPNFIDEKITPLFWLFGIFNIIALLIVAFQLFVNSDVKEHIQKGPASANANKNSPNIILVTFDALTTKDMSVYGYSRETTPFINEWAKSAVKFSRLKASSTFTTPATASLMTGKRVWTHQTFHQEGSKPVGHFTESLPLLLKNSGYYTMSFIQNDAASARVLGIDNSFHFSPPNYAFYTENSLLGRINRLLNILFADRFKLHDWIIKDDFILNKIIRYFPMEVFKATTTQDNAFKRFLTAYDDNPNKPFFAWLHLNPPHDPYLPPEPYMGMFDPSLELRTAKSQSRLIGGEGRVAINDETPATIDILRARYDEFIRYCDREFEDFTGQLAARDLLRNTVVILSSDHGESFEHNTLGHGSLNLYEELISIPFIIKEPGNTNGKTIDDTVEQIDIPATVLDIAGIPVPLWMEGRSVMPLINGSMDFYKPAYSMALFTNTVGQEITQGTIAVWEGDYKLIHYLDTNKSLLFNLKLDPHELNDLWDKEPEKGQHLLSLIRENLDKANRNLR